MDNEQNIQNNDDIEIIDIPDNNNKINDNISVSNGFQETPINQNNNLETNNIFDGATQNVDNFNLNNNTGSSNEIPNVGSQSFTEINTDNVPLDNQSVSQGEMGVDNTINPPIEENLNDVPTQINTNSNVYIPKNDANINNDTEPSKKKMDKSLKEMIAIGIIIALVIILLPFLYNLSIGKYHIMSKISGLFNKKPVEVTEKAEPEEEMQKEDVSEEQTEEESFDFSKYNGQVIDNKALSTILSDYKNNVIALSANNVNGIYNISIYIAKDMSKATTTISNPDQITNFNNQYLVNTANYLITVTNQDDNTIIISAVQQ